MKRHKKRSTPKGKYKKNKNKAIPKKIFTGIMKKHGKGFGFVLQKEKDIFIPADSTLGAMTGDLVEVAVPKNRISMEKISGQIVRILHRGVKELSGTLEKFEDWGFVCPHDKSLGEDIFIRKKHFHGAQDGDQVVVAITKYPLKNQHAEGEIIKILGRKEDPRSYLKSLLWENRIKEDFPEKVKKEMEKIQPIQEKDLASRRDLKSEMIITIDGADAKDFDDAISCKMVPNGFKLGVHIADVTHYVSPESAVDQEAMDRGTSIYFPGYVVPMLPTTLSNELCSLKPYEDRLTLSCEMEIDLRGEVRSYEIFPSVIQSKKRCIYEDISHMIEEGFDPKKDDFSQTIYDMNRLASLLHQRREKRGSIDFNIKEPQVLFDSQGMVKNVEVKKSGIANNIIEEFMLLANEVVAKHCFEEKIPLIYRTHGKPEQEKLEQLRAVLVSLGLESKGIGPCVRPKDIQNLLKKVSKTAYRTLVEMITLRSMEKAVYQSRCFIHFGLGLTWYCHFTSPIRRYPDLMVHRMIKDQFGESLKKKETKILEKKLEPLAAHCSQRERRAIDLEREMEKRNKVLFMSRHIGEISQGLISGITGFGLYVQLPNTVEGMVSMDSLKDDVYVFEENQYRWVGKKQERTFRLGDEVTVKIKQVNLKENEIDFILV